MAGEPANRRDADQLLVHYIEIRDQLSRAAGSADVGADLAQETYYRALRSFGVRREIPRNIGAWLNRIARNVLYDHFRRWSIHGVHATYQDDVQLGDHEASYGDATEYSNADYARLAQACARLETIDRALVIGFYFERKGCHELATEIGISHGTAKVRLHRARVKLRRHWYRTKGGSDG